MSREAGALLFVGIFMILIGGTLFIFRERASRSDFQLFRNTLRGTHKSRWWWVPILGGVGVLALYIVLEFVRDGVAPNLLFAFGAGILLRYGIELRRGEPLNPRRTNTPRINAWVAFVLALIGLMLSSAGAWMWLQGR